VFEDDNTEFTVALSSWWQVPAFIAVVEWARDAFLQEAMFVQIASVAEIYLPVQS
jgi:hypothetical protein